MTITMHDNWVKPLVFPVGDRHIMMHGLTDAVVREKTKLGHIQLAKKMCRGNTPDDLLDACVEYISEFCLASLEQFHNGVALPNCEDDEDIYVGCAKDIAMILMSCEGILGKRLVNPIDGEQNRVVATAFTRLAAKVGSGFKGQDRIMATSVRQSRTAHSGKPQSKGAKKKAAQKARRNAR